MQQHNIASDVQDSWSLAGAKGAWCGERYKASLQDRRQVWYDGERIEVTKHPDFVSTLNHLAALYDLQHQPELCEQMLYTSPLTGNPVSYSWLAPSTQEELSAKWRNSHLWMEHTLGMVPRVPDFMSNVVVGLYDFRHRAGQINPRFKENIERYYLYCRENDISLTHAIGDPQIDRSATLEECPEAGLRVLEKREDGIVVRGAKNLATLAPFCHEALIYMSPSYALRKHKDYVVWFSVAMETPGLHILCREAHVKRGSSHQHLLSERFDEQDAMLFFDDVFIPNERIFLLEEAEAAFEGFFRLNAWALYVGQIRFYHRLRTFLGVTSLISQSIGVNEFREIQNQLGELSAYLELIRHSLVAMNAEARVTDSGLLAPASTLAPDTFAAQISGRINEIVRTISGAGLIMQPSPRDLATPELRPFLDRYMRGKSCSVDFKSRLFRFAWEMVADAFGSRQDIYELWNRGDVVRNRIHLYKTLSEREEIENHIRQLIDSY
ncbi:4-hydroxyphenylacetate 3-hydroxylase family protein [Xenorhabdus bovienii]|uniref:4-hydroxyphenylacetate 3-hydroxylase n=1 Tax=Xenorhabdus bovienii str. feltiae Moldova TaxID=1398200 RepID=A0A077NGU5_XENBV|nr:4-hydroxyphenylacetate 3-hydroxylase N-terminal domain-containing protein [Xenorhabdus bovienii]CDH01342.1 4-hydroxyphenylacetate 3-hydroxylase [Xenorhabdus bovienii str. feltiae Moldova]